MSAGGEIDPAILDEAAGWLVTLQSGDADEQDWAELQRWRQRSPTHDAAWLRAEHMLATFSQLPPQLGRDTLARLGRPKRRQALRLGLLALALPAGWLAARRMPWQEWNADLRTATGEQRTEVLADGTRLVLNTGTAVNIRFSGAERRLVLLSGEVLIDTGKDRPSAPRPFLVETAQGALRPLGTRFSVRSFAAGVRVAVFEGRVEVLPNAIARSAILRPGEQMDFSADSLPPPQAADASTLLWQRGMLLARGMPLGELLDELARYHHGVLRCAPAVAGLKVSGAFPVADLDASLSLLEKTLPVQVLRVTPYWISVRARQK